MSQPTKSTRTAVSLKQRLHNIGMAMFGPANSGPYGPAVPPPTPRPRDAHGRLLKTPH